MTSVVSGPAPGQYGAVAIVAPTPPPLGGMALQALALHEHLIKESITIRLVKTNPELPAFFARLRGIRTVLQTTLFVIELFRTLPRVSVVHVFGASFFYFFARVTPAVILARIMGRRVILNYRGGAAPSFFARFGWAAWPIVKMADLVTVPSAYLERCFLRRKIACRIVPSLVDVQKFKFRRRDIGNARLLVNRNLEPMYNVAMALRAFEIIKKKFPAARFDIVGCGSQESSLKNWVAHRQLTDVVFHGAVANERMPEILDKADVLLNPTHVDNLPISLLEAFASGLPVISTNVGGIPDLVGQTGAALLVGADNHEDMAGEIEKLFTDPGIAFTLVESARDLAEKFAWPSVRQRLLEAYYPSPIEKDLGVTAEENL